MLVTCKHVWGESWARLQHLLALRLRLDLVLVEDLRCAPIGPARYCFGGRVAAKAGQARWEVDAAACALGLAVDGIGRVGSIRFSVKMYDCHACRAEGGEVSRTEVAWCGWSRQRASTGKQLESGLGSRNSGSGEVMRLPKASGAPKRVHTPQPVMTGASGGGEGAGCCGGHGL